MVRLGIIVGAPSWTHVALREQPRGCRTGRASRGTCRALGLILLALVLAPSVARSAPLAPAGEAPETIAEALYLCDPVPTGGQEVSLAFTLRSRDGEGSTGGSELVPSPRVQLALALSDRLGLTVDLGFTREQGRVAADAPGASLKLLLLDPAGGRTGLATSIDLFGSTHSLAEAEVGLGLGALRAFGPVTARASLSAATTISAWGPHLHAGASVALALSSRVRALAELVADLGNGERAVAAGPTLKGVLADRTTLAVGALLPIGAGTRPLVVTVLLTQGI